MNKITDKDLANRGVKGLPDVPGLTTEEMQRKLEEIAREILVPKVNEIIDNLIAVNSNLEYVDITITYNQDYFSPLVTTGSCFNKTAFITFSFNTLVAFAHNRAETLAILNKKPVSNIPIIINSVTGNHTFFGSLETDGKMTIKNLSGAEIPSGITFVVHTSFRINE